MSRAETTADNVEMLSFSLNGAPREVACTSFDTLAEVLRGSLGLKGTKIGCGAGECGACTVMVNGRAICSCIYPARRIAGAEVTTIEGLGADEGSMTELQGELFRRGAFQCGYCAPGMILSLTALFRESPNPSEEMIRTAVQGNVCRCSGYLGIIRAANAVAQAARP